VNNRLWDLSTFCNLTPREVWDLTLEQWFIYAPTVDSLRAATTTK